MNQPAKLPIPPAQESPDNAEYHAGLAEGRLLLPRCDSCGVVIWYPRHRCPDCGSGEVTWFEVSGRGTVYSFTIVRAGPPPFHTVGPYVLAYVQLEEGPRVLTNLVVASAAMGMIEIGDQVEACVDMGGEGGVPPLLRFRPIGARPAG